MGGDTHSLEHRLRAAIEGLRAGDLGEPVIDVCIDGLRRLSDLVARAPVVAVVGLPESGKTPVAFALAQSLPYDDALLRNCEHPVRLRWGAEQRVSAVTEAGSHVLEDLDRVPGHLNIVSLDVELPLEGLKDFEVLDVPFPALSSRAIRHADIAIWCTPAAAALSKDEAEIWRHLPERHRRYGMLAITRRDVHVLGVDDAVPSAAIGLFRDVVEVTLPDGETDQSGGARDGAVNGVTTTILRERVLSAARAVRARRARKAERIAQVLARMTFHDLGAGEIDDAAAERVEEWRLSAARVIERFDCRETGLNGAIEMLLTEFAHASKRELDLEATAKSAKPSVLRARALPHVPRTRRMLELLAADLCGLLRLELLGRHGVRPEKRSQYRRARAILLDMADLDGAFAALTSMVREPAREMSLA